MIFKYLKAEHLDGFFRDGTLRIGTLYEYRNTEKHGSVIGDEGEGVKSLKTDLPDRYEGDNIPAIAKQMLGLGDNCVVENVTLTTHANSDDCYIFCATEEYSKSVMAEFKATACFSIDNVDAFYAALTKAINRATASQVTYQGLFRCQYTTRHMKHEDDHGLPGVLIKDPKHSNQKEARAIWTAPSHAPISPIFIKCPEARQYCSIYPKLMGTA